MVMEKKILIVEDEVLVAMMLAKKLEGFGFSVCDVVSTGEDALLAEERDRPGAILMDVSLGGEMDGLETVGKIRVYRDVPVVFFTGYHQDRTLMERAKAVGALAVLDKLGPIEDIVAALENAFQ
jgi:CheY-like chemotaxis protein